MNNHRRHPDHRPLRLAVPSARLFPVSPPSPFSPSSLSTPSKLRRHNLIIASSSSSSSSSSYSSLLLLLFSLRSLYSLLPFLRSSPPSFSLFPFSFLVSLLSFSLSTLFSLSNPVSLCSLSPSSFRTLALKSLLLALALLLRFQSLRFCTTSATILTDLAGSLFAFSLSSPSSKIDKPRKTLPLLFLTLALFALSRSWDRVGCSPLSRSPPDDNSEGCVRVLPMLLPFLSGFLGYYEKDSGNWGSLKYLGRKKVRSCTLGFATLILFFPALVSVLMNGGGGGEGEGGGGDGSVSIWSFGWPLVNTALFGVLLNENFGGDEKAGFFSGKDFQKEFVVTFCCTLVLEMFYFPKLSLPGFLVCGFLMWVAVRELGCSSLDYVEIGASDGSESLYSMVMKPVRHILSERKSRKIAMFLLINTGYMVVEFVAGFMSNSLGLISDACHMLFDCAALGIGLYASYISRLPADHRYNYGRGRMEVLSGYANAVLLVLVGALIVLESIERILDPQEISTNSLLTVSIGGLLVNVVGLIFFHEEHHHAHGGGGTCSHSHSHSHSDTHHHHEHEHKHEHDNSIDHGHGPKFEHHTCVGISHESSNGHSHADRDHHHSCGSHNDHQHDPNKENINISNTGRQEDNHDHHCHDHGHDHHSHEQGHDHKDHPQKMEVQIQHNGFKPEHNIQRLDASSTNSHIHCHEGHKNNHCHGDKESCNHTEKHDHSHIQSSNSKKGSTRMDSQKHRHIDHNMEGIFLHVLADTMGSVGVVISTLLIKYKGWLVADPACSIFISVMIVASVVPLLRNSAEILLQRIPRAHEQDLKVAIDKLMRIEGVCGVQKLHVWNFTNNDIVGTLHLHVSAETDKASVKKRISGLLHEAGVKDITLQVESIKGPWEKQ